ncbi:MAG: hypothetical protein ACT6RD_05090 [Brevundimonas sp.]|uniref:hypothetical protein n=1 Tax=Brevundimonas sp. TaxID=1871086 RepID=UPI0040344ED1
MKTRVLILSFAALAGLAACSQQVKAPFDKGVCYSVILPEEGSKAAPEFNVVARDQPQIEHCAAQLEQMRVRFLRLGGNRSDIVGSYQGQFIFIDRAGVWQSKSLNGNRFFALARTGDGRLAVPGAIDRSPEPAQ